MAREATIEERPVPPRGRLSFPMLMLRILGNPVASWGEDFYQEGIVAYRWLGVETAFVMDPEAVQTILTRHFRQLFQTARSTTRCSAPRSAAACSAPRGRSGAGRGGSRRRCSEQRTCSLRAGLRRGWPRRCSSAGEARDRVRSKRSTATWRESPFRRSRIPCSAQASAKTTAASSRMPARNSWFIRSGKWLCPRSACRLGSHIRARAPWRATGRRCEASPNGCWQARARAALRATTSCNSSSPHAIPATGEAMPDRLIIDNLVTFLVAGHETTSQALTWSLYLLALFPEWQERVREEVRRVVGQGGSCQPRGHRQASSARCGVPGGHAPLFAGTDPDAADDSRPSRRRRRAEERRDDHRPDLCGPPPPQALAGPAQIRSLALRARSEGRTPPLRLYAVRRWPENLHRRHFRHGRGQDHSRHDPRQCEARAARGRRAACPLPASRSAPRTGSSSK